MSHKPHAPPARPRSTSPARPRVCPRRSARRRGVGASLLLCGLLLSCITGDIRVGEDNLPPRIPYSQVDPKAGLVVISDTTTQLPYTFKVLQFEEPNLNDTLTVRWFVDYHRNPAIQSQVTRQPEPLSTSPALRTGSQFALTLSMLQPNPASDPHLVEVVVCDRAFDDRDDAPERNRTCSPPAIGALLSWTVQIATTRSTKPDPQQMALVAAPARLQELPNLPRPFGSLAHAPDPGPPILRLPDGVPGEPSPSAAAQRVEGAPRLLEGEASHDTPTAAEVRHAR